MPASERDLVKRFIISKSCSTNLSRAASVIPLKLSHHRHYAESLLRRRWHELCRHRANRLFGYHARAAAVARQAHVERNVEIQRFDCTAVPLGDLDVGTPLGGRQ